MKKWQPSIELERLIQLVCQHDREPVNLVVTVSESDNSLKVTVVIERTKK